MSDEETGGPLETRARDLARSVCDGFKYHDMKNREQATDAFTAVDSTQFPHIYEEGARRAAASYVTALWEKDTLEERYTTDGRILREELDAADWTPVRTAFAERSAITIQPVLGEDAARTYAEHSVAAWKNHKTGGDYWTPIMEAQVEELRAAMHDPTYPQKPEYGQSGYGAEPARYALAVELHDMHTPGHWEQAIDVMTPYFEKILESQIE